MDLNADFTRRAAVHAASVRVALAEKGLTDRVEFVHVDVVKGEHRALAFLALNPSGTVPVLELDDGTVIAECTAITEYLDQLDGDTALTGRLPWQPSPTAGVDRRMLDRVGGEVARATTIVRYAPDSRFPAHTHGGGEEFLVLDGVFQDEHGDFPAGSYIRNPPGSRHTPGSAPGCTIFGKLWQFDPDDRAEVRLDTRDRAYTPDPASGLTLS